MSKPNQVHYWAVYRGDVLCARTMTRVQAERNINQLKKLKPGTYKIVYTGKVIAHFEDI